RRRHTSFSRDWSSDVCSSDLTDLKFSQYLTLDDLERLIAEVLSERGVDAAGLMLSINPELAPIDLVFEQALTIERLPPAKRTRRSEERRVGKECRSRM